MLTEHVVCTSRSSRVHNSDAAEKILSHQKLTFDCVGGLVGK